MREVLIGIGLPLVFLLVVLLVIRSFDWVSCNEVGEVTGKPTQWHLLSGCYVQVDERWIPRDSWRGEQE